MMSKAESDWSLITVDKIEEEEVSPRDSVSQVSNTTSSSRAKLAAKKAALKVKEQALKRSQEIQRKKIELEQLEERVHIESELAAMEAEEEVLIEFENQDKNIKVNNSSRLVSENDVGEFTRQTFSKDSFVSSKLNPNAENWDPQRNSPVSQSRDIQHDISLIDLIHLPKADITKFDGNPLNYWTFIRSFDNSIGHTSVSNGAKLTRLIQFCTDKARDIVEACIIMNPNEGYVEARRLLAERFGNPFVIAQSWIEKVVEGPAIRPGDKFQLRNFSDTVKRCIVTLKAMDKLSEVDNQLRMLKIVDKLPNHLQYQWRKTVMKSLKGTGNYPKINELSNFIEAAADEANDPIYGFVERNKKTNACFGVQAETYEGENTNMVKDNEQKTWKKLPPCKYCSEDHAIFMCKKYKQLSVQSRLDIAKKNNLCFNCFSSNHRSYNCPKPSKCGGNNCSRKHSWLLHVDNDMYNENADKERHSGKMTESTNVACNVNGAGVSRVALPIVPINIEISGKTFMTHALLDQGSTSTFCTQDLIRKLGITGKKTSLSLTTLTSGKSKTETEVVSLVARDMRGKQSMKLPHVYVVPEIPILRSGLVSEGDTQRWAHIQDIHLPVTTGAKVELLIGQDNPSILTPLDVRRGNQGEPYAVRTILGWTLNGPLEAGSKQEVVAHFTQSEDLQTLVSRFWKIDSCGTADDTDVKMSVEDKRTLEIWNESLQVDNGHYKMDIPFRKVDVKMPNNYGVAECRLETLGKRLAKNKELHDKYSDGIQDLLNKGYAEIVPKEEIDNCEGPVWYIPHHAVFSEKKPEKLRIVFDCASEFGGTSLNKEVLQGPDLTNKLIGVLLRFRQHQVAIVGDIESMFHQVKVTDNHRDALRFLWWPNGDMTKEPNICRMTVHLFGGVWSPSCANFAVRKTVEDYGESFDEETVKTVLENLYVDDCVKSVPTDEQAIKLVTELSNLLEKGGFRMTKWLSSSRRVLEAIPQKERAKNVKDIDLQSDVLPQDRALGVTWMTESDAFGFKVNPKDKPLTKRGLISVIGSIYDPFGFMCPVILQAKLIFQDECRLKKAWDAPLEEKNAVKWKSWLQNLPAINDTSIDRCLVPDDFGEPVKCNIHHFADASLSGYGAVSYLRVVNADGRIHCSMIMGKSRLAPIKQLTIPRLELLGAVTAVKLDQMLRRELNFEIDNSVFWSDSMVVLHYIRNESQRYQTFVANRISMIHSGSSPENWRYVESGLNPADYASRGLDPDKILLTTEWFDGPEFLWQTEDFWPKIPNVFEISNEKLEVKRVQVNLVQTDVEGCTDRLLNRYSSWYKLKRQVSWILRLKKCLMQRIKNRDSTVISMQPLTVEELRSAELEVIRYVQSCEFSDEISRLKKGHSVKTSSSIRALDPVLDASGILCVGGRLQKAPISENSKHQYILPKTHQVSVLIVRSLHQQLGHVGKEHVLARSRQRYWIVNGRTIVKRVLKDCVHCRKTRGKPLGQKMADLPRDRVTPNKPPFSHVGIDCFGPFYVKRARSELKRYGCIFTCLCTRAIHIEKIDSLDTDSFINAFRRFEARRGTPELVRTDNGTNFKGAKRELTEAIGDWNKSQIEKFMLQKDIKWIFNTPAASHMGGVWERQIRTVRKVLNSILCDQQGLQDEGLTTLFCEVERIINSRPITVVSDSVDDLEALTPNHLLLLKGNSVLPPGQFCARDVYRKRWKHVQFIANQFWKRWLHEYLPTLQVRRKWKEQVVNLREGDIVLLVDEHTHRNMWQMGRVLKTLPSEDGLVRTVQVKTKDTVLTRPIQKLCYLEGSLDSS